MQHFATFPPLSGPTLAFFKKIINYIYVGVNTLMWVHIPNLCPTFVFQFGVGRTRGSGGDEMRGGYANGNI